MSSGPNPQENEVLVRVATYERVIGASIERVWENVLDWEHLPWLHYGSFASIELERADESGWRAMVEIGPRGQATPARIEVSLDRPRSRYTTSTLSGIGEGTKIVTTLDPVEADATRIHVQFLVPGIGEADVEAVGALYLDLYGRLWDEDEEMMQHRQALLDARATRGQAGCDSPTAVAIGREADVRSRVPLVVPFGERRVRIVATGGDLVAHDVVCPHLGGPLDQPSAVGADEAALEGSVVCPWHGYRFDVRTGRGLGGCVLKLRPAPRVEIDPLSREVRLVEP